MQIAYELRQIDHVVSVHDLHIWELISGVSLASVHMDIQGSGAKFMEAVKEAKRVFHRNQIHSVTIQPEFVSEDHPGRTHCQDMCVEDCVEVGKKKRGVYFFF
jgi:zinc transporter 1